MYDEMYLDLLEDGYTEEELDALTADELIDLWLYGEDDE